LDRIAIISDIHGNIPALEAVLRDIRQRRIKRIFCLGDLVGKGPDSDQAVDICRERCEIVVRGNWDEALCREQKDPMPVWYQKQLGPERMDYLKNLPNTIDIRFSGRNVRLFHASPVNVFYRVQRDDAEEKLQTMFTNTGFTGSNFAPDTVGYGDIHYAYIKHFRNKVLFNAGSVGNPLDYPLAAYAILEGRSDASEISPFSINIVRLPYDIERTLRRARELDMPELEPFEIELRTSRFRGLPPHILYA
jgi:protein phosphatase